MKKVRFFSLLALLGGLLLATSCIDRMGMIIPAPNTKPTSGDIPGGDPFNPDDPTPVPPEPVDPMDAIVNNPERLARLGQTPIIEIYYTEYTKESLFPSLEEVRNFTHINVGHVRFVDKQNGVGIEIDAKTIPLVKKFVAYKQEYPELKVKLQMGGWGKNADGWSQMASDPAKRKAFIDECLQICEQYDVDGFDIDWEYPTYAAKTELSDGSYYFNGASPADWENFVTLFKEMRAAMPKKILSYAASDSGKYTDNFGVLPYIDYINVMSYDEGNPPYHNAPLYRSTITGSRCCSEAIEGIFHEQQGIPYQMMNFGLAFYGHGDGYKLKTGNRYPDTVDYSKLEDIFFNNTCDGMNVKGVNYRIWDDVAKVPYLADAMGKMYASYEDIESINAKVAYLKEKKMLGAMIWEYRHDNAQGTLRHAVKHAMDGNPDEPGYLERPDEYIPPEPAKVPVMGKVEWSKKLRNANNEFVVGLSGLCLSKDKDFLWGVGDRGQLYKIDFDGNFQKHWYYDADMEAVTIDPSSGYLYLGIEPKRIYRIPAPDYSSKTTLFDVDEAASMGNSGIEGIAWYKGDLYIGAQTGATLWKYSVSGIKMQDKISLRNVAPTLSEIADLCYDPDGDFLWVMDSNGSSTSVPNLKPYTLYLFDGAATKLLATYDLHSFANWNPEAVCVDRAHGCIWVADDCGDDDPSILHKIDFTF
jgi:chitinase